MKFRNLCFYYSLLIFYLNTKKNKQGLKRPQIHSKTGKRQRKRGRERVSVREIDKEKKVI